MTTRSQVSFKVKQYPNGQPWILMEEYKGDLGIKGILGFDVQDGTSFDTAQAIANYLEENIKAVTYTS